MVGIRPRIQKQGGHRGEVSEHWLTASPFGRVIGNGPNLGGSSGRFGPSWESLLSGCQQDREVKAVSGAFSNLVVASQRTPSSRCTTACGLPRLSPGLIPSHCQAPNTSTHDIRSGHTVLPIDRLHLSTYNRSWRRLRRATKSPRNCKSTPSGTFNTLCFLVADC